MASSSIVNAEELVTRRQQHGEQGQQKYYILIK